MSSSAKDEEREERIQTEIIVDMTVPKRVLRCCLKAIHRELGFLKLMIKENDEPKEATVSNHLSGSLPFNQRKTDWPVPSLNALSSSL